MESITTLIRDDDECTVSNDIMSEYYFTRFPFVRRSKHSKRNIISDMKKLIYRKFFRYFERNDLLITLSMHNDDRYYLAKYLSVSNNTDEL